MKNETKWPRAILLDFYGTVVVQENGTQMTRVCHEITSASSRTITAKEVSSYWARVYSKMIVENHGSAFRCERDMEQECLAEVLLHFDADMNSRAVIQNLYEYWVRPEMFPESMEVLKKCSVPVCLVSNIDIADLASALEHNGLSFDLVVTSEGCRSYKPRPEMFEEALSLLDLSYDEVLHVGDSLSSDVRGAKALGIPVLWINRRGRELPDGYDPPDYVSTDLTGILNILNPL